MIRSPSRRGVAGAALVGVLLLTACAGSGASTRTAAGDENQRLRGELLAARQRAVMAEVEAERLASLVAELERQLAQAQAMAGSGPAARPAMPVEDGVTDLGLAAEIEEVELEEPPAPADRTSAPAPSPSAGLGSGGVPALPDPAAGESPQGLYDRAYALFHEKRYAEAEQAFRRFLDTYPDSHLADNAQFWIGECRWARGDFSSALVAFSATVDRYPHGNKVADALLKAGRSLEALGQRQQAVATYQELATRFPGSAAALAAEQRLAELSP